MSHFLSTLSFIPEWQTVFPQMVGEAGKEAVIMTRLQPSFPRLGIPTRISPNPEEGNGKGRGCNVGIRFSDGPRKEAASSL
jgi:hypothetical protein